METKKILTLSILFLVILGGGVLSYHRFDSNDQLRPIKGWTVGDHPTLNPLLKPVQKSEMLAKYAVYLQGVYSQYPVQSKYADISLPRIYEDSENDTYYYLFTIDAVDDMEVVFLVNREGRIVDNYLVFTWR